MASIRARRGNLFVDFRYMSMRCRETTNFTDTVANRKKLAKIIEKMEAEITLGIFDYSAYFPKSERAQEMQQLTDRAEACISSNPSFKQFSAIWYEEKKIEWRPTYRQKIQIILDKYLLPAFGNKAIHVIKKPDLMTFRSSLAKVRYGKDGQSSLSVARINQIMIPLSMILEEASDRYSFEMPYKNIKNLKQARSNVSPFTLNEVWRFIQVVRRDYKPYYTVRFFTGMRTSEIDGLKWECVNFERREIHIQEALVNGQMGPTKTLSSQRDIAMSQIVYEALLEQKKITYEKSEFVFCNSQGNALEYRNVNRRVWGPTLALLGLKHRRAYQTRHTAATLWLGAGENPEWIARQMGHSSTEMLFRVYSRYVPDITRQDGSAMDSLILASKKKLSNSTPVFGASFAKDHVIADATAINDNSVTNLETHKTESAAKDRDVTQPTNVNSFNPFGHMIKLQGNLIDEDLGNKETHHENN